MAPNLNLQPPLDETLVIQPMITKDANSHGSHSVVSNYAKKESAPRAFPQLPKEQTSSGRLQQPVPKDLKQSLQYDTKEGKSIQVSVKKDAKSDEENSDEQQTPKTRFQHDSKEVDQVLIERLGHLRHLEPLVTKEISSPLHRESAFVVESQGSEKVLDRSLNVYELILSQEKNKRDPPTRLSTSEEPLRMEVTTRITETKYENKNTLGITGFYEVPATTFRPSATMRSFIPRRQTTRIQPNTISTTQPPVISKIFESNKKLNFGNEARFDLSDFGHLDEDLADFSNLFHHQKSLEELTTSGKEVAVKEDWLLNAEVTSAVILMGMCSIITMLICFIFVIKRYRGETRHKKEGKQVESTEEEVPYLKPHLGSDIYSPSNFIPHMSLLSALSQLTHKPDLAVPHIFNPDHLSDAPLGRLWFSVRHDEEKSDLHVNVLHARYPNGRGVTTNTGELWIEGKLITPMNKVKATSKTSTRRATISPVFNHNFLFLVHEEDVKSLILKLILYDKHPKKGECVVGSVILPFSSIDLNSTEIYCRDLL